MRVKRRIKLFLSLCYTVIFVVLASTGVLQSQAAEPGIVPTNMKQGGAFEIERSLAGGSPRFFLKTPGTKSATHRLKYQ